MRHQLSSLYWNSRDFVSTRIEGPTKQNAMDKKVEFWYNFGECTLFTGEMD